MALFNRQKAEKGKCKGQESTIGKIIYSFLLFMPLLAILSTVLYTTFNKNAYLSYESDVRTDALQQMTYDSTTHKTNAETGTPFIIQLEKARTTSSDRIFIEFSQINVPFDISNLTFVPNCVGVSTQYVQLTLYDFDNLTQLSSRQWSIDSLTKKTIDGISTGRAYTRNGSTAVGYYNVYEIYDTKLNNVFYNSVSKVEKSNLFNWAENTGTYTVVANTTTLLGINNTFIPMLLTYWLIISIIYFIYDIGLMLVWIIHRKIHELQESI